METLDDRDREIIIRRWEGFKTSDDGPVAGEWMIRTDGSEHRCGYQWGDGAQPAGTTGYHLGDYGCSYSGSLDPSIPNERLRLTGDMRLGAVWIFHHGYPGRDMGVWAYVPFRVWEEI